MFENVKTLKKAHEKAVWHEEAINCFALHNEQSLIVSGDLDGRVFCSNYMSDDSGI